MASRNVNIDALKLSLVKELLEIQDVLLLQRFVKMMQESKSKAPKQDKIVGFEADGSPVYLNQVNLEIATSIREHANGKVTTAEDLEKEMETWQ